MRKLICTFSLIVLATITLAAHADSFTYDFGYIGRPIIGGGFSSYIFTEPSILTVDTVIPIADISTNDMYLSFLEINPASPGAVLWTDSLGPFDYHSVADFSGALTSTGTFSSIDYDYPAFPATLTIAESPEPVPESSSFLLLSTGALGFLTAIIRQKSFRKRMPF